MIEPIKGRWWLDDGKDSGVWPTDVLDANVFGVRVRPRLGPDQGETFTVDHNRVYDSGFNRVRDAIAASGSQERSQAASAGA